MRHTGRWESDFVFCSSLACCASFFPRASNVVLCRRSRGDSFNIFFWFLLFVFILVYFVPLYSAIVPPYQFTGVGEVRSIASSENPFFLKSGRQASTTTGSGTITLFLVVS